MLQGIDNARAQKSIGGDSPAAVAVKHSPAFADITRKLDGLLAMSQDLSRRSIEANDKLFGPKPQKEDEEKMGYEPDSFVGMANRMIDATFENLNVVQAELNKIHVELETSE